MLSSSNATVFLNKGLQRKMEALLNPQSYRPLEKDATAKILGDTNRLIKISSIPQELNVKLVHSEPLPSRMYGLPKSHKTGITLRPIASTIGCPTQYCFCKIIFVKQIPTSDSTNFVQKLSNIVLNPGDIMVRFDIVLLLSM